MAKLSTTKGKVYERKIATLLREAFPGVTVRRASQADRAGNSDVFVVGHPVLERLWLELTDSRAPNPFAKLQQAERDVRCAALDRVPVVIWHKMGERRSQATMRAGTYAEVAQWLCTEERAARAVVVTMDLDDFLSLL